MTGCLFFLELHLFSLNHLLSMGGGSSKAKALGVEEELKASSDVSVSLIEAGGPTAVVPLPAPALPPLGPVGLVFASYFDAHELDLHMVDWQYHLIFIESLSNQDLADGAVQLRSAIEANNPVVGGTPLHDDAVERFCLAFCEHVSHVRLAELEATLAAVEGEQAGAGTGVVALVTSAGASAVTSADASAGVSASASASAGASAGAGVGGGGDGVDGRGSRDTTAATAYTAASTATTIATNTNANANANANAKTNVNNHRPMSDFAINATPDSLQLHSSPHDTSEKHDPSPLAPPSVPTHGTRVVKSSESPAPLPSPPVYFAAPPRPRPRSPSPLSSGRGDETYYDPHQRLASRRASSSPPVARGRSGPGTSPSYSVPHTDAISTHRHHVPVASLSPSLSPRSVVAAEGHAARSARAAFAAAAAAAFAEVEAAQRAADAASHEATQTTAFLANQPTTRDERAAAHARASDITAGASALAVAESRASPTGADATVAASLKAVEYLRAGAYETNYSHLTGGDTRQYDNYPTDKSRLPGGSTAAAGYDSDVHNRDMTPTSPVAAAVAAAATAAAAAAARAVEAASAAPPSATRLLSELCISPRALADAVFRATFSPASEAFTEEVGAAAERVRFAAARAEEAARFAVGEGEGEGGEGRLTSGLPICVKDVAAGTLPSLLARASLLRRQIATAEAAAHAEAMQSIDAPPPLPRVARQPRGKPVEKNLPLPPPSPAVIASRVLTGVLRETLREIRALDAPLEAARSSAALIAIAEALSASVPPPPHGQQYTSPHIRGVSKHESGLGAALFATVLAPGGGGGRVARRQSQQRQHISPQAAANPAAAVVINLPAVTIAAVAADGWAGGGGGALPQRRQPHPIVPSSRAWTTNATATEGGGGVGPSHLISMSARTGTAAALAGYKMATQSQSIPWPLEPGWGPMAVNIIPKAR